MCRKYETGFPVHDTDPFSGSILETCIMVPISAMQSEKSVCYSLTSPHAASNGSESFSLGFRGSRTEGA